MWTSPQPRGLVPLEKRHLSIPFLIKCKWSNSDRSVDIGMEAKLLLLIHNAYQSLVGSLLHPRPQPCCRHIGMDLRPPHLAINLLLGEDNQLEFRRPRGYASKALPKEELKKALST